MREAAAPVDALRLFMRFVGGRLCGTALEVGLDALAQPVWTEWGFDIIDPWRNVFSWYPRGCDVAPLLATFIEFRSDGF